MNNLTDISSKEDEISSPQNSVDFKSTEEEKMIDDSESIGTIEGIKAYFRDTFFSLSAPKDMKNNVGLNF